MARTSITPTTLTVNGSVTDPTSTATGVGDGNGVTIATGYPEAIILRVQNTGGAAANVSVKAGTLPTSLAAGQGDLVVAVAASSTAWVGPFESARFAANDGSISVDSSAAVNVTALRVGRH